MVQKEIKRKTRIYGTVAMLSAIVLVALIYVFGSSPVIFPPTETPSASAMKTFSSYEQLRQYLVDNSQGHSYYKGGPLDSRFFGEAPMPEAVPAPKAADSGTIGFASTDSYSTTNIQVAGVDEADIVKTDGAYIYTISSTSSYGTYSYVNYYDIAVNNTIYIIKADPQDPRVTSKITLDNTTVPAGLFLSQDSNRLVVLASRYQVYTFDSPRSDVAMLMPYQSDVYTFINVYDVSDKAHPVLARNLTISGSYFNSRMIGNYVYAVVSQPADVFNEEVALPKVYETTKMSDIEPSSIYYTEVVEPTYFTFTTFIGIDILDDAQQPTNMTIMMGGTSTMYVSPSNMYVTYPTWNEGQYTSIYRVSINGDSLVFEAKGSVPGYVLNQYSMDEYNGHFRVATTWQKTTQMNNVYVLNMSLAVVGKLENLAEGERIYSARFMGDKAYLVTFRQIDPFFVIDLSNQAEPKVAGELKIPGYSSYLHPFDENYVIGLGKENNTVKLSLFDVSNVNDPTEIAKYIVEGDWTDSEALYEPKAFLFDKQKALLVIPISKTNYGVVDPSGRELDMQGGFWQGAYVFKLTLTGFELKGGITHQENTSQQYYSDYNQNVNRALYIGNTLYTVSNAKVKLNSLDTLALIAEVNLR